MKKLQWDQIGIMNMNYLFYTLDYFLDAARDMGVKNVNLWAANPHLHLEDGTDEDFQAVGEKMKERGLRCFCVCPEQVVYPFNIAAEDAMIRRRSITAMKRAVKLCRILGSPLLHICPGWGFYDKPDGLKLAWELSRDAMIEIGKAAAEEGITLALEPLQIVESNLVGDIASAKKMLDEVASDHVKLLVDTCHMAVKGENLEDYFRTFGKDLVHIHLNESGQVPWGYGNLPLETYVSQLEEYEFEGTITLEVCARRHYIDPNKTVRNGVDMVRKAICG
ncbi:MAG: sugar phosphate isomerase/epimerase [Lachnospiraceae bacterium]|nr:sugar phosphate isomerase/epimerase [Lachnospiraceae bacterium]